ncbi:ATP-binding protein [Terrabacter sp. NPDC080008]|uniref:ATP-binding protein n=1 Tax=Terrabacter sp. NPDC080008 TaxID=3155176 RepID=UPI00344E5155
MGATHDWSTPVDTEHLDEIRCHAARLAPGGLLHLALEVLAYPVDEAREGATTRVTVVLHADGSVSVADDGRGTETRVGADGVARVKPVMATKDLRFFGRSDVPVLPDGHRRSGISVVAALSEWLVHTNRRAEGGWSRRFEHGLPVGELEALPPGASGTVVQFRPDPALVDGSVSADELREAARTYAAVVPVEVVDERS